MGENLSRRGVIAGLAGLASGAAAFTGAPGEQPFAADPSLRSRRRPNILVILGDDLGWADLSSYGSTHIKTPHLDGLAAGGIRFTDGYSAAAVCSPTRIALYTGRYPGRLPGGLPEPIGAHTPDNGIPPTHPTLASLLKRVGYATAMFGKWHCGFLPWFSPLRSGWDEFFGNATALFHFDGGSLDIYRKMVENMDRNVGKVLAALRRPARTGTRSCCSPATTAASAFLTTGR
ncbi:sulfatase-like hydrolase/transferase [Paractinoplanes durhamensis]|uniref:sulfatase-like hydrolase/transferase n=1 Tax=Paractinoplanes durhamensis TaxID=113563 RepID=UPI0036329FD5